MEAMGVAHSEVEILLPVITCVVLNNSVTNISRGQAKQALKS